MKSLPRLRRLVVFDEQGGSRLLMDGLPDHTTTDPARPGFSSTRYWVSEGVPAKLARPDGDPSLTDRLEPPPGGAVFRMVTYPPDSNYVDHVTASDVAAYFESVGAPHASTYRLDGPHPYMQKTETLDFCLVVSGRITLVLDTGEVHLVEGDTVVQRATNHAWSNRSDGQCVVAFSSHDARKASPS